MRACVRMCAYVCVCMNPCVYVHTCVCACVCVLPAWNLTVCISSCRFIVNLCLQAFPLFLPRSLSTNVDTFAMHIVITCIIILKLNYCRSRETDHSRPGRCCIYCHKLVSGGNLKRHVFGKHRSHPDVTEVLTKSKQHQVSTLNYS